jgi:hypothetical protein
MPALLTLELADQFFFLGIETNHQFPVNDGFCQLPGILFMVIAIQVPNSI